MDKLTPEQIEQLILLCYQKIEEYKKKKDGAHWKHRKRTREPVSGTVRYEVLKRAKFRCELCGIPAEEKSLDVDHITPKSLGGKDDIFHCHVHLIPRRKGDVENPRGGVRHIIPGKGYYEDKK